jgi:hypothetical protein
MPMYSVSNLKRGHGTWDMIANLFFWNKTIYQKVEAYLRGLAQLSFS